MIEPGHEHRAAVPLQWRINGLDLAGLAWGDACEKPLLALHGWLDNAASFSRLAPLLKGYHVVALDLTGHGLSARRSPDATYQIWDDLPEIVGVLEELGWDSFDLMGHSRGAIMATILAGTCPERVNNLVLLDAVVPQAVAESDFTQQMCKALKDKSRLLAEENRVFSNTTEAVSSRVRRGLPLSAAEILVERNVRACPGGVTWTTDPRLHGASAVKMTEGQIRAVLGALDMPTQLLLAEESYYQTEKQTDYIQQHIRGLTMRTMPGGHHFHMESGVAEVAACVHQFLTGIDQRGVA
jgi:pimeloyl-ACP methyl ester carboxylesterase